MIRVVDEVSTVNPLFVGKVIAKIVEHLADEMLRLMQCVPEFSANGATQARLDLTALSDALHFYKTEDSSACFLVRAEEAGQSYPCRRGIDGLGIDFICERRPRKDLILS